MSSANGRPATRGGKAVLSQRGGKGKWGAQSPPTVGSPVPTQAASPVLPSAGKESIVSEVDAKHMHDRMLFLLTHMIGMTVELTVKNGSKYEGLFHTAFTEGDLEIVLRLVKVVSGKDKKENAPLVSQMIVLAKDCVAINVVGVDFVPHERTGADRGIEREGFKTDTDISRSGDIKERDLKKWAPEEYTSLGGIEDDVGESHFGNASSGSATWDQFAANEKLFGVRTDFDEELYTTRLDRSGADFKAREQYAIQIANEIQQTASTNVHMQEERGLAVDDSGLDEEDRYGAVVRNPLPPSNKYMPPAMRRQQELQQQKRPTAVTPQQPARASPPPTQAPVTVNAPTDTKTAPQKTANEVTQPVASSTAAPTPTKPAEPATVSRSNSTKGSNGQFNLNELRTHNPVSALLNAATIQGSKHQQIPDNAMDAQYIEENMAQFAQKARTFANTDKDLVKQTKLGLTQRRTELMQKEKDDFKAELKQFGKELTKKLTNTPVPDDVKEIFSKKADHGVSGDKSKEPSSGAKAAEKTDKVTPTEAKDSKDKKVDTESAAASAEKSAAAANTTFKLNVKASVFKPNVKAAPFTPSFGGADKKAGTSAPAADKNLFFGRPVKKGRLPLEEAMSSPFTKGQAMPSPKAITPTWPYGQRSYVHLFTVTNRPEDDMMYSQGMGGGQLGNGGGGYYAMGPYGAYGPGGQYGGPPPMGMGSPNHMMPFMPNGGPVPFSQPPPPGMPHTGAGPGYPQVAQTSAPHYAPQGFTAGRSGMIPPSGMPMPMYHYPPNHGGPIMMRYPPEMMPPMGPNGMMMQQRPLNMEPQMMPYPPSGRESTNEGDSTSP